MTDHIGDVTQMVPMTQQRLDEIRARCNKATPGPWVGAAPRGDHRFAVLDAYDLPACHSSSIANTAFIARAREDIPALLAEVERLRVENNRLRAAQTTANWEERTGAHPGGW